jgi:mono/diheme cytochrome c family protein
MSGKLQVLGTCVLIGIASWLVQQDPAQDKGKDKPADAAQEKAKDGSPASAEPAPAAATAGKKNPVRATPEVLNEAKKIFGYDCAMCHGDSGDGKGDLADSMKLTMKNWHENGAVEQMDDQAIYDLIIKGKDKMVGEGDRLAPAKVWGLVHYVRTLGKKKSS